MALSPLLSVCQRVLYWTHMKRTGLFFTYFHGQRLADFPDVLEGILDKENVFYYDAHYMSRDGLFYIDPIPEALVLKVHSQRMVDEIKRTGDYEAALYGVSGTVQAAREIEAGRLDNAFVFTSWGDHHAGRDFYGGMCYLNGAAIAIADLRERGAKRFCIVDTDAHHADGTRDIFARDADVLHVCFCYDDYSDGLNKIDFAVRYPTSDDEFIALMEREFLPRVAAFRPEVIFWEFGYDATQGEYADKGLTPDCHVRIARLVKGAADRLCRGRLVTILCGGSGRGVASYAIPRIVSVLAELA